MIKCIVAHAIYILLIVITAFTSCKKIDQVSPPSGQPPATKQLIANAGIDQTITLPIDTVTLDGVASSGAISSYQWRRISGPTSFTIQNATAIKTVAKNLIQGVYLFELKVTDAGGLFSTDTVKVDVNTLLPSEPILVAACGSSMTTMGHLSVPGMGTQIVSAGSKIFISSYTGSAGYTDIYDTISHTWSTSVEWFGNINIGTKLLNATYTYPVNEERFEFYDAATGLRNTHVVPEARAFIQSDITGNKVIFAGGIYPDYSGDSKRIDIYDNSNDSWTLINYDSSSRYMTMAAISNKIFFAGGYYRIRMDTLVQSCDDDGTNCNWYHPSYPIPKMDIYDMLTRTWSVRDLSGVGNLTTAKVGNKLLFFHGFSRLIDIYDASTDTWSLGEKSELLGWTRAHAVGNKVLLTNRSNKVGIFDVTTNSWSTAQMPKPNNQTDYLVATVQNKILFFYVYDHENDSKAIDIYDASSNTWCHGQLNRSLVRSAIGVAGNKIYIAGGITKTNPNGVYNQFLDNIWLFNF